ncbi:hypothetical protein VNO80_09965 [Phaseolus coccineus]|uniref:Peptidase metallopeptidase domain-containing protein n=1 Tax=Phaseolus coccineus TaxID=3886 RepID=A0AAN9N7K2_PHACN
MKPNLSAFLLLFLLLLDQSLCAKAGFSSFKNSLVKWVNGKKPPKPEWDNEIYDFLRQKFSPPQQNQPMKGLSRIKDYFSNFGYLQSSGPFDDYWDLQTASAIKTFQRSFDLQVTGTVNNQTIQLISRPRCAVPDMDFSYNFTDNVSLPKAGHQWFQKRNLTYGFLPASEIPANFTKVFRDAFARWVNATGFFNLTETAYDDADIKVGFYTFTEGVNDDLFGFSFIREKPPSNKKTAEIRLNGNMYWALPSENDILSWEDGILDLESVAIHEIGHLLGLDHSFMNESVMYPYILPSQQRKIELPNSDKNNIKKQYANVSSGDGGCLGVPSLTTLSLGFAYLLLMY